LPPTRLLYLEEPFRLEASARVLEVRQEAEGLCLVLDRTVLYPQGGGQISDRGRVEACGMTLDVVQARLVDGVVEHRGDLTGERPSPGLEVRVRVNEPLRRLHSRLHSAGHLIDVAMRGIGCPFPPTRGYHFPDGPYVEYAGSIVPEKRDSARAALDAELDRLIAAGSEVQVRMAEPAELPALRGLVSAGAPKSGPTRVVTVAGELGCPCGGTHVRNLREPGRGRVLKLRGKGGNTRISYAVG
jgi:Ser-tRNA(Ala) deacylase AlaX